MTIERLSENPIIISFSNLKQLKKNLKEKRYVHNELAQKDLHIPHTLETLRMRNF